MKTKIVLLILVFLTGCDQQQQQRLTGSTVDELTSSQQAISKSLSRKEAAQFDEAFGFLQLNGEYKSEAEMVQVLRNKTPREVIAEYERFDPSNRSAWHQAGIDARMGDILLMRYFHIQSQLKKSNNTAALHTLRGLNDEWTRRVEQGDDGANDWFKQQLSQVAAAHSIKLQK